MDETRIDAGPTPAHVFAYRAFRSVFVHSPESSPIKPQISRESYNNNKENAPQLSIRGSRFTTSPVNSKRKDSITEVEDLVISLTPKRQRTIPVSPTKSILKNPHAPTPRRAELRDVTVTFRDVRKSVSPDLAKQRSPRRTRSQPEFDVVLPQQPAKQPAASVRSTLNLAADAHIFELPKVTDPFNPSFDLDSYKAQTEKEMRRLIKYGQKWKEQAKRQEEENTKLQELLEQARKENDRLQKKLDERDVVEESKHAERSKRQSNVHGERQKSIQDKAEEVQQYQSKSRKAIPTLDPAALHTRSDEVQKLQQKSSATVSKSQARYYEPTKTSRSDRPKPASTTTQFEHEKPRLAKQDSIPTFQKSSNQAEAKPRKVDLFPDFDQNSQNDKNRKQENVSLPTRSASDSTAMADDRLAAARARLEKRRLARAASTQAMPESRTLKESSRLETDESQVDWLAMA